MTRDLLVQMSVLFAELSQAYKGLAREAGEQYYDQHNSPLGRRLHCRLARTGELTAYRAGRRVLIKASHVDAYLEAHKIKPTEPPSKDNDDDLLGRIGGRAA